MLDFSLINFLNVQFALHYSWSTEARARQALANVSALLRPGGIFIGTMPDANVIVKKLKEGFSYYSFEINLVVNEVLSITCFVLCN